MKYGYFFLAMISLIYYEICCLYPPIVCLVCLVCNGELAFLDTLLKQNDGEISVLVYMKSTHTDQYLQYSFHHQTSCKESVVSSLFNRAYSIITNKDDLY